MLDGNRRVCFGDTASMWLSDRIGDTRYFSEHIAVDVDEHASWMAEAVAGVVALYGPESVPIVTAGMADAWEETREVPDRLWERQCASR